MVMSGEKAGGGNGSGSVAGAVGEGARGQESGQGEPAAPPRVSLRERKKQLTYRAISDAAIAMFLERGFDKVSVAEVAAAADISKPTLFRYFPAKEDLALHRFADHEDEAARVVGGREPGESPLDALRRHFLAGLDRRDPVTGLCDAPQVLAFHRLLYGTPSLVARLYAYQGRSEAALARALGDGVPARLAAGQVVAVLRILAEENWRRIDAGESADAVYAGAVQAAEEAFVQLRRGLEAEGRGIP
ncbi:TetR family transcriptional regulator [Streptomyces cyaneofuscatus]|uniref:TetR/AcrR family transcriptional regulator n=1 Tax=Streptomyces cyaneofuscatus TaxID=66883 RepID=UPI0029532030|nr:TetR family transcriptional regulator [Streptomyces cyaneofuscatus]WOP13775.1 TetR family transcriptional regulator [Streptomyces cyaneofuscatus]